MSSTSSLERRVQDPSTFSFKKKPYLRVQHLISRIYYTVEERREEESDLGSDLPARHTDSGCVQRLVAVEGQGRGRG